MSVAAFRRDTEDPEIVRQFSEMVGVEERLKMLLMTLADVEAVSRETLTAWKEELLWRLYVDTYNFLTLSYSDEVIDRNQSAIAEVIDGREQDLTAKEVEEFLQGLPRRYLQLFSREAVPARASLPRPGARRAPRLARKERRGLGADGHHERQAVPVLEHFGRALVMRHGHPARLPSPSRTAWSSTRFHFVDEERFLELNPEDGEALIIRRLEEVIAGRADIASRLKGREEALRQRLPGFVGGALRQRLLPPLYHRRNRGGEPARPAVRVSRAMSESGCDVDSCATEGRRAIDVFHLAWRRS